MTMGRLGGRAQAAFFYLCLTAGGWLFGGLKAALVLVVLIAACNRILGSATAGLGASGPTAFSLTVRSLLSLGLFPFIWLIGRLLPAPWLVPVLGVILAAGLAFSFRDRPPAQTPEKRDYAGMIFVLALVVTATRLPFSKIGYPIEGRYAYRAYFSSDYLKHFSVVESLNNGPMPPQNLYFAGEALHYYWLPYALPAVVAKVAGSAPKALFAFSFTVNFLFLFLLLQAGQRICRRRPWVPFLAVPLVLAPSLEGFYLWAGRARLSFTAFFAEGRSYNIDGLTRWLWNLPQIDTLLRSLFYTPQHLLSLAFLLLFLVFAAEERERPWLLSLFLAMSLASSFFVGGILFLSRALFVVAREAPRLLKRALSVVEFFRKLGREFLLPLLVLAISIVLGMVAFAGTGIVLKPVGPIEAVILLGLNLGLLTISGTWGLLAARFPSRGFVATLLAISLVLILAVRIANFESDISLKAGLIVILALTLLTCRLGNIPGPGRFAAPLVLLILGPGMLTAGLDIRNSADIRNVRFTSYVGFEEMRMLEWVRKNVPAGRVVQNYPAARTWNLSAIPAFSGRPMAIGDRLHGQIFQVRPDAYKERLEILRLAIAGLPATRRDLRGLGIDYLFWGEDERRYFGTDPAGLSVAYRTGGTVLYAVGPE
ncbi:MAG: hypothetical protein WAU81_13090 [Candidatus Aminicenantales bacterium]